MSGTRKYCKCGNQISFWLVEFDYTECEQCRVDAYHRGFISATKEVIKQDGVEGLNGLGRLVYDRFIKTPAP